MDIEDFFQGPGETARGADEILLGVLLPPPPPYSGGGYVKLGKRKALEISIVNVAAYIALESPGGAVKEARIALGAVAPTPLRAREAEKVLTGERPGDTLFDEAGKTAPKESRPIDDFRGSAEYRREMVALLTKRALQTAFLEARERELRRWE